MLGALPVRVAIPADPPLDRRILCPTLVGRERELALLDARLVEASAGRGRAVLVGGDAGSGKTKLLATFLEGASKSGVRVLAGDCREIEARRPFGPFVDMVQTARASLPRALFERSLAAAGVELTRIASGGDEVAAAWMDLDRSLGGRAHTALATFFAQLAAHDPLVLAIEDLHWADEASLELIPYMGAKLRDHRVLLVGTYRTDELHRTHPLRATLAELTRGRIVEDVALPALTAAETGEVIRGALRLRRGPTAEFRATLHERCEGNPFFIEEVLKALVDGGELVYRGGAWVREKEVADLVLPRSVQDAVEWRSRTLPETARRVFQLAAVIGRDFDLDILRSVSRMDEPSILDALRLGIDAQLLVEVGSERFAFRHALIREAIQAELLRRQRRVIHRSVGEALEQRTRDDPRSAAEELAYHFDAAGDSERARRYHELAASEAQRSYAFRRAAAHLERTLELAPDDTHERARLELTLAQLWSLVPDHRRMLRAAEAAAAAAEACDDRRRQGLALMLQSRAELLIGDWSNVVQHAREGVSLLEPLGDSAELALALQGLALHAVLERRWAEGVEIGERAAAVARAVGAEGPLVLALDKTGAAMAALGRPEGVGLIREAITLGLQRLSHGAGYETLINAYNNLVAALSFTGATLEERRAVESEQRAYLERFGLASDLERLRRVVAHIESGDWDEAVQLRDEFEEGSVFEALVMLRLAFVVAARDGPARSDGLVRTACERLARADPQSAASASLSTMTFLLAGQPQAVLDHAEVLAPLLESREFHAAINPTIVCALLAAATLGDEPALRRWLAWALADERPVEPRSSKARRAFARAEEAALRGDADGAVVALATAAQLLVEDELAPLGTLVRLRRADLLLRRGRAGDAQSAASDFAAVLPYWRKAKATWFLGRLREWARERGLPFPATRRGRDTGSRVGPLTWRERQVAALVAHGLTNRQIAARLVVSERTAEGHVERIRNKLGFRSRVQIARWSSASDVIAAADEPTPVDV